MQCGKNRGKNWKYVSLLLLRVHDTFKDLSPSEGIEQIIKRFKKNNCLNVFFAILKVFLTSGWSSFVSGCRYRLHCSASQSTCICIFVCLYFIFIVHHPLHCSVYILYWSPISTAESWNRTSGCLNLQTKSQNMSQTKSLRTYGCICNCICIQICIC